MSVYEYLESIEKGNPDKDPSIVIKEREARISAQVDAHVDRVSTPEAPLVAPVNDVKEAERIAREIATKNEESIVDDYSRVREN